jgi:hypothetical protein
VSETLWASRPTGEQAVEPATRSVDGRPQEPLARQAHQVGSLSDRQAVLSKAASSGGASTRRAKQSRCSFCRAELDESLKLTIPGSGKNGRRTSISSFCSTHCRACVLALAALHPSPLASTDFLSKRALLTDRLLELWRRGQGPDPALVLEAAKRASCGLPFSAVPAVLTGTHTGTPAHPLAKSPANRSVRFPPQAEKR